MKTRKVNRYYCDFCKKTGGSKFHMEKHERGCTKNPNRVCGICNKMEYTQQPMTKLIEVVGDVKQYEVSNGLHDGMIDTGTWFSEDLINAMIPKLRDATENCPMCMLAALRQSGIPVPAATAFNYKNELQGIWNEINDERAERDRNYN